MSVEYVLVRIDDRLIHGQVAVGWAKATSPTLLVVADDAAANDNLQKTLMEMAATPSFGVKIFSVDEIVAWAKTKEAEKERILLLFSTPQDVLRAVQAGLSVKRINVGGMRYSPGKKQIMKAIAINADDAACFKRIIEQGIHVSVQMVPTDEPVDMKKYL